MSMTRLIALTSRGLSFGRYEIISARNLRNARQGKGTSCFRQIHRQRGSSSTLVYANSLLHTDRRSCAVSTVGAGATQMENTHPEGQAENSQGNQPAATSSGPRAVRLGLVVEDLVKRWFEETLREAKRGDVKMQALVGQMYMEGYGCEADPEQGKQWIERARQRGYRMSGVYCEL